MPKFTWKVDKKGNYIKLELIQTLLRMTRLAHRKSYLVIICPNVHAKLTKSGYVHVGLDPLLLQQHEMHMAGSIYALFESTDRFQWSMLIIIMILTFQDAKMYINVCVYLWHEIIHKTIIWLKLFRGLSHLLSRTCCSYVQWVICSAAHFLTV